MFDKKHIPSQHTQLTTYLNNLYTQIGVPADIKQQIIDKKFSKVDHTIKDKISKAVTVSDYLDQLWKQADLKQDHKDVVIKKLIAIENAKVKEIKNGEQKIAQTATDLNVLNEEFKMTPFEEFNYQERLKNIRKTKKLDMENDLFSNRPRDLDVLNALNRPVHLVRHKSNPEVVHYTAGLCDGEETDVVKAMKAEDFVKKIKDDKKAFHQKVKKIEKSMESREQEELDRFRKLQQHEEEKRLQEKKKHLEEHIKELKTRSEVRLKQNAQWEEEYKIYLGKRPLFKEIERKFKKETLIPELETRKKKLKEIRDFHKPIGMEDIMEHEQKVTKKLEDLQLQKKVEAENSKWVYQKPEFESKLHRAIADELTKARKQKEEEQMEKLRKKEKVMELMQEVKERHLPRVDPQKEMELLANIEKLKKKEAKPKEDEDGDLKHRKLGAEYLKSVKEEVQKRLKEHPLPVKPKEMKAPMKGPKKAESDAGGDAPVNLVMDSTKSDTTFKKRDYLADLRKDKKVQDRSKQVDAIIKNKKLDDKTKEVMLQGQIEKLEDKARRKEMVRKHKVKKSLDLDDDDDEVDQIYVSAIKAKIELLAK